MTATVTPAPPEGRRRSRRDDPDAEKWSGPTRRYDIIKEFVIALVVVSLLTVVLAVFLGSPDEKAVSLKQWANATPNDFIATAAAELDGTSGTATYGPPYNNGGPGQQIFFLHTASWGGIRIPVNPAQDFVIDPLEAVTGNPALTVALAVWNRASPDQQQKWATNYEQAISATPDNNPASVKPGDYGPVPVMLEQLMRIAQAGALDGALTRSGGFYVLDYTRPLLFLSDGSYLADKAAAQHLSGDQWGMMNETGSFPGQPWLWLYTFWYQIEPFKSSGNADALIWGLMGILSLIFVLVPFIPGLRSVPRFIPIHRLIWRRWYQDQRSAGTDVNGPVGRRPVGDFTDGEAPAT